MNTAEISSQTFWDNSKATTLMDGINGVEHSLCARRCCLFMLSAGTSGRPTNFTFINITDNNGKEIACSQPRSRVHSAEAAQSTWSKTSATIGQGEGFSNRCMELVVGKDARLEYLKFRRQSQQVSTTHIRHIGKSYSNTVTISLDGGILRNNLNIVWMRNIANPIYTGLYYQKGQNHVDNHTVVDNVKPNCFSNQFYKGIMSESATAFFNGKNIVRPQAQRQMLTSQTKTFCC
jgi:Fe-S cluster assembly protein SufD